MKRAQTENYVMAQSWTVIVNTGLKMELERGLERRTVTCPANPTLKEMFIHTQPGQPIADSTLTFFLLPED